MCVNFSIYICLFLNIKNPAEAGFLSILMEVKLPLVTYTHRATYVALGIGVTLKFEDNFTIVA